MKQAELEDKILMAFYEHAQKGDGPLTYTDLQLMLGTEIGVQRIKLAVQTLSEASLVSGIYAMNRANRYSITNRGYRAVESEIFERLEKAEAQRRNSDPIEILDAQLAPAAGRMVSFGDNEQLKTDALESVEKAEEIVRSSNTLEEDIKAETSSNLASWRSLIQSSKNFAVGAFKYLVWDRLKAAMRGSIEDAYKALIIGIMITLGTLIVGLL